MIELLPLLLERVGLLVIVAFLLSRLNFFRKVIHNEHGLRQKILLIIVFGLFGVISNYTGVQIHQGSIDANAWSGSIAIDEALANTRVMGVTIGGLLGGPFVGIGVGLIAGLHRLTLGGFTAVACCLSTILAGIVAGFLGKRFDIRKNASYGKAVAVGVVMEIIQMGLLLLMAKPYIAAFHVVEVIAIPMIVINGFGTFMFLLIIKSMISEEERTQAVQTQKALYIAQLTLPYFRQGLNEHSCQKVAEIIRNATKADAISITNKEIVLAHIGLGDDHHINLQKIGTNLTRQVIEEGRIITARNRKEIGCKDNNCPLNGAIVLPLIAHQQTVGTLKLYFKNASRLTQVEEKLTVGLSRLFSMQLELAEAELQRKLLKDAEIKALQAQVHPHFLFNSINTISSLIRRDADQARQLLIKLSTFFRSNLQGARQMLIPLKKELEHVDAYLSIEQARFPNKYKVSIDIDPTLQEVLIPPFTLQPLIENAIHHGFSKLKNGAVSIRVYIDGESMVLCTEDNGKGIPADFIKKLGNETVLSEKGTGTALWNIKSRIKEIYGDKATFEIVSESNKGTRVLIKLPLTSNM